MIALFIAVTIVCALAAAKTFPRLEPQTAYEAGFEFGKYGPTSRNVEMKRINPTDWERGRLEGRGE